MVCKTISKLLNDYLADRLDPDTRALVDEHLAQCETCRNALRTEDQVSQFLSSASPISGDDTLISSLMEKVQSAAEESQKKSYYSLSQLPVITRVFIALGMTAFFILTAILVFKFNAAPESYFESYGMDGYTWIGMSEEEFVLDKNTYPEYPTSEPSIGWGGSMAALSGIVLPGEDEGRVSHSFSLPVSPDDSTHPNPPATPDQMNGGKK